MPNVSLPESIINYTCMYDPEKISSVWKWFYEADNGTFEFEELPVCSYYCPESPLRNLTDVKEKWDGLHWAPSKPTFECPIGELVT